MEVAPRGGPDVAGHALLAPAEVVGGRDVGEEVEAGLVPQPDGRLHEALALDDHRRLAVAGPLLDEPRHPRERLSHSATPRIS